MLLQPDDIKNFMQTYEEAYGESITEAEAEEMADRVLRFVALVSRPLPEDRVRDLAWIPDSFMLKENVRESPVSALIHRAQAGPQRDSCPKQ